MQLQTRCLTANTRSHNYVEVAIPSRSSRIAHKQFSTLSVSSVAPVHKSRHQAVIWPRHAKISWLASLHVDAEASLSNHVLNT
jgi:hypothetical protein